MVNTILANVGTVVCFRSGNPADEQVILPLFSPYIEQGEIANLPSYNFYARISAVLSQEPVSGETLLLDSSGAKSLAQRVIAASRTNYATKYVPKEAPQPKSAKNTRAETRKPENKNPESNNENEDYGLPVHQK